MDNLIKKGGGGGECQVQGAGTGGGGVTNTFTTPSIDLGGKKAFYYVISYYFNAASGGTKSWNWKIQGSDDDSTWTDVLTGQKTTPASTNTSGVIEDELNSNYRYFRLQYSQGGAGNTQTAGSITIASK